MEIGEKIFRGGAEKDSARHAEDLDSGACPFSGGPAPQPKIFWCGVYPKEDLSRTTSCI